MFFLSKKSQKQTVFDILDKKEWFLDRKEWIGLDWNWIEKNAF